MVDHHGAAGAAHEFRVRFGADAAGVWGAPGRVNIIGEHTDYNDGFVLPIALGRLTAVAAAPLDGPEWIVYSEATGQVVRFGESAVTPDVERPDDSAGAGDRGEPASGRRVTGWAGYVAGVVWALRSRGYQVPGARLCVSSDVPLGAGLSSSAAMECAVLAALADLGGLAIPDPERPAIAQRAEAGYVGMPCGIMDQSAAVLCRERHALFLDCRSLAVRQIPFDLAASGMALLVIDTRAPHRLVTGEYAARRADCEAAARALGVPALRDVTTERLDDALRRLDDEKLRRRVRHVVGENARVLATTLALAAGDLANVGGLLSASHASLRDDYEVTVPELDVAVEAALAAGAEGARMTGGGFGGCVLALVDTKRRDAVTHAVTEAFAARGFTAPTAFETQAGAGARRLA